MTADVRCGTCRYWQNYRAMTGRGVGECGAPAPDSVDDETRVDMPAACGVGCDAWEPDANICPMCGRDIATDPRRCESCREVL